MEKTRTTFIFDEIKFMETAKRAYYNTSFTPEKRAIRELEHIKSMLPSFRKNMTHEVKEAKKRGATIAENYSQIIDENEPAYQSIYVRKYESYLHSLSRCASSVITGPSNFPVERNKKHLRWASNKNDEVMAFDEKFKRRICKKILPYGDGKQINSDDPNAKRMIEDKIKSLKEVWEKSKSINKVARRYIKNNILEDEGIEPLMKALEAELHISLVESAKMIRFARGFNGYIGTQLVSTKGFSPEIKRLKERLKSFEVMGKNQDNIRGDYEGKGICFSIAIEDGRIAIYFEDKPIEEVRGKIKSFGFRWSPFRSAWVRKETVNAHISTKNLIRELTTQEQIYA